MNARSQVTALLPFATLLALAGCASTDVAQRFSVYGAISLPPDAKIIGLTVARPGPEFALQLPTSKGSAARSAASDGARGVLADPQGALLFPVGYVMGGIVGGILGVSEGELKTATRSIQAAVDELHYAERIALAVREHLNAVHPGRIRDLQDNLPMESRPEPGRLRRGSGKRLTWTRSSPAPHPLAGSDVEAVIGIRIAYQGFQARPNPNVRSTGDIELFNPPLTLVLTAEVSALRVRDWADLGGLTVSYESAPRKFTEWAAGDAAPLRRESEAALLAIISELTRLLDGSRQPPLKF